MLFPLLQCLGTFYVLILRINIAPNLYKKKKHWPLCHRHIVTLSAFKAYRDRIDMIKMSYILILIIQQ
ncbi:hypothetical protein PrNR1418_02740 [Providencia rettgeri]|nr:hypothetical protein PrNR1418_02740 [Providencia rettgeri]